MSRRKLLLADDSVTIQKVVNLTFADEGIEVFAVSDGIEAVDRLMEISPDLVMADVNMPGINGYLVCERIKQHEKFRNTPVILLVGSFEPFDEQEAKRVGADDYLTKPFQSIRQLVSKVSDLLERPIEQENAVTASPPVENSFAETQEEIEPPVIEAEVVEQQETPRYEDGGYDDEMIQTNQASSFAFDEASKFASRHYVEPREEDYGKTQPLSAADLKEIQSAPDQYVSAPQEDYSSTAQEDSTTQQTYQSEVSPQPQSASRFESDDDDDFLELFDDDEFEDEEEEQTESVQPQPQTASAEEVSAESRTAVSETENYQTTEAETYQTAETETAQSAETETVQSAETFVVQPIEAETVEAAEAQSVQAEETERVSYDEPESVAQTGETETEQPGETEAMAATASSNQQQQQQQQLSPEMIDAIAQRVIEKLSETAVKEIAWEVVPQQADLIIKKMVEEKLKE